MPQLNTRPLGTEPLWGFTSLPSFYRGLTRSVAQSRGKSTEEWDGEDIAAAIRTSRRWAGGDGTVTHRTRARAASANAEWEAKKRAAGRRREARKATP